MESGETVIKHWSEFDDTGWTTKDTDKIRLPEDAINPQKEYLVSGEKKLLRIARGRHITDDNDEVLRQGFVSFTSSVSNAGGRNKLDGIGDSDDTYKSQSVHSPISSLRLPGNTPSTREKIITRSVTRKRLSISQGAGSESNSNATAI